jgi:hypothetical protein
MVYALVSPPIFIFAPNMRAGALRRVSAINMLTATTPAQKKTGEVAGLSVCCIVVALVYPPNSHRSGERK